MPARYVVDVLPALVILGTTLPVTFVVTTQQAMADVEPAEVGLASGIFESANHLLGGAVGVAGYAALLEAAGYRAAFVLATVLVAVFAVASLIQTRSGRPRLG